MQLTINTPSSQNEYAVVWLEINTPSGNYVIQSGHVPTIMILSERKPLTFRLKTGKQETIVIRNGIIKVSRTSINAIIVPME